MAFVKQEIPEDEQNKFALTSATTPNPLGPESTGGSVGAENGGTNNPASGIGTSQQFGTNASKLSDYLKANAPLIENQGTQISNDFNNQFNQLQGDINTGVSNFGEQVKGGYAAPDENLVNDAASNPSEFVKNTGNVNKFKSLYNDSYTGPTNFQNSDY